MKSKSAIITFKKFVDTPFLDGWYIWQYTGSDMIGFSIAGPYIDKIEAENFYNKLPASFKPEEIWNPDAPFRKDTKTPVESFKEGWRTGYTWKYDYTPGGPHVYVNALWQQVHPDLLTYAALTEARFKAWHEGFQQGKKDKANTPFPFD